MFDYFIIEDIEKKETFVRWYLKGNPLVLKDGVFPWNKYGRQGAYQAARVRVRALYNAESLRREKAEKRSNHAGSNREPPKRRV